MVISVSNWENVNEAQGLLPQTFTQKRKLKREGKKNPGKQFLFVTWFPLVAAFPYQPLAVFCSFSFCFFTSALNHTVGALRHFFLAKSLWRG